MGQKKLGLSFRGGGAKTAAYVGVLRALEEEGIKTSFITGCSGGSIVAVSYAAGVPLEKMTKVYGAFTWTNYVGIDSIRSFYIASVSKSLASIKRLVGDTSFSQAKIPVWIQVTDFDSGKLEYLHSGSLAQAVIASSSAPFWMKPCKLNGKTYLDGGITSSYGVKFLKGQGAEAVIALGPIDESSYRFGVLDRYLRPLFISIHHSAELDLALNPPELLINSLGDGFKFLEFNKAEELAQQGYEVAKEKMKIIKKLLFVKKWWNFEIRQKEIVHQVVN